MQRQLSVKFNPTTSGFTLLEVMITVILIGILFAIAAPNWVAFMNQQRVSTVRNQVAQAIRSAQSQAQQTKVNRAIVFQNNNDQPRYAIVPAGNDTVDTSRITNWQTLGEGNIRPGTIRLWGNRVNSSNEPVALIFDSYGAVVASVSPVPYRITIEPKLSVSPKRCVSVETILGATAEGSDSGCTTP